MGLHTRVPLALSEADALGRGDTSAPLATLRAAIARVNDRSDPPDVDTRLAGVVVAWNVLRHFYPYWTEAGVDWPSRLRPALERAFAANTRESYHDSLRLLIAEIQDGHGSVRDTRASAQRTFLPVRFGMIEGRLVVTASATADVPVGAVVSLLDGVPAERRMTEAVARASGTPQWKQSRALGDLAMCQAGARISFTIDIGSGPRPATVTCEAKQSPEEKRPAPLTELDPGIWDVDLTRARAAQVQPALAQLSRAKGIVFDVRGYPTDAGAQILPHLLDEAETDRWMHVNQITGPGESAGWMSVGWNVKPAAPRLAGTMVFLTDGRAISYAESVMGYVADRKLATIVGSTTAGANGNVAAFNVPGGFNIAFTGMRVTRHDGRSQHHLVGVKPDVAVTSSLAGLRAGRDDVLERGLALIRGQ